MNAHRALHQLMSINIRARDAKVRRDGRLSFKIQSKIFFS